MNMIRIALLSTVAVAAMGAGAQAADLMLDAPVVMADEVVSDWTGPYVGIQAGVISLTSVDDFDPSYQTPTDPYYNSGAFGGTVGVFAGYDLEISDVFVLGLSGEVNLDNVLVEQEGYDYYSLDWDAAIKVRAGMLVDPSTLVYATVGYSYAAFSFNEDYWGTIYSDGDEVGGIVVGAGIETMLTDEIFLRAEGSATFYDTLDLKYEDTATPYSYWDISSTVLKASIGLGFKF